MDPPGRVVPVGRRLLVSHPGDGAAQEERWEVVEPDGSEREPLPDGLGTLAATSPEVAVFVGAAAGDGRAPISVVSIPALAVTHPPPAPPGEVIALGTSLLVVGAEPSAPRVGAQSRLAVHRLDGAGRWTTTIGPPVALNMYRGVLVPTWTMATGGEHAVVIVADRRLVRISPDGQIATLDGVAPVPGDDAPVEILLAFDEVSGRMTVNRDGRLYCSTPEGTWVEFAPPVIDGDPGSVRAPIAGHDGRFLIQLQYGATGGLWWFTPH